MNYQHHYHAGNFADVMKHAILLMLLAKLREKEAGFFYLDSHAGAAMYDLSDARALKTAEAQKGACQALHQNIPELSNYLTVLKDLNCLEAGQLIRYPGSAAFASHGQRPQDRLILNDQSEEAYVALRRYFRRDGSVSIHRRDAYELLPAVLPPALSRGLILIDPAFEDPNEYARIVETLSSCLHRFRQGIYLIWTPLTYRTPKNFKQQLEKVVGAEVASLSCQVNEVVDQLGGLVGCTLWIINPPWRFMAPALALVEACQRLWLAQKNT